ncbi:MAG: hypothetical protein OXI96_07940 [Acidimicrobiaceae bacterium]|nr:hypothetical protein [Acidimicrobiaceae bacterium]
MSILAGVERLQLTAWAGQVSVNYKLPPLIRQSILEATPGLVEIDMSASEGTAQSVWDGIVRSTKATSWVPAGLSLVGDLREQECYTEDIR